MHRFYVKPSDIRDNQIYITDQKELRHMERVLRLRSGDQIIIFDGKGTEYEVTIEETFSDYWIAGINKKSYRPNKSKVHLSLIQGIAKGDKMDTIIQKAVEIGVDTIYPVLTDNTVVKLHGERSHKRWQRWESIALEACKQCGRNTLPQIKPISTFVQVIDEIKDKSLIMLYEKEEELRLQEILRTGKISSDEIYLLVGPEGGFSPNEVKQSQKHGALLATLGQNILRTETASIIGSALILYELGDLG